jgi:hypothetical protein
METEGRREVPWREPDGCLGTAVDREERRGGGSGEQGTRERGIVEMREPGREKRRERGRERHL